ncbi:MAG: FAD-dependent oxidoreductase, partial [Bacteroidota bacterium]
VFKNQARFNSQQYLQGLAMYLSTHGVDIYENSRVIEVEHADQQLYTEKGSVKYKNVILATHLPLFIDALQTLNYPFRSYLMIASVKDMPGDALFWDQHEPYFYTRQVEENKILVGGVDHQTGYQEDDRDYYQVLKNYIKDRYEVISFHERWSSQYYEPADGLPYIGETPFKNSYVATGFSGDGLVYGTISAMILTGLLTGNKQEWAKVYDSKRLDIMKSGKKFLKENTQVAKHLIEDRLSFKSNNDPLPGQGIVMHVNEKPMAVFKDKAGDTFYLSPVCPHLKCHVTWNNMENTWDCPCHGSRFDHEGQVLQGPAVLNLDNKTSEILKKINQE